MRKSELPVIRTRSGEAVCMAALGRNEDWVVRQRLILSHR